MAAPSAAGPPAARAATVLLVVLAAAALAAPAAGTWEQFRGDVQKTGNVDDPSPPRATGWTFEPAAASQLVASAVTDGNTVVIADYQGQVTGIDILDGSTLWSRRTPDFVTATPALAGDLVLVPSGKSLLAFRVQASGSAVDPAWSFNSSARIDSPPTVAGGAVFVGSDDRSLYKLDLATGAPVWSFETGDVVKASPSVSASHVIVASYDGKVYALHDNGSNVSIDWTFDAAGEVAASPAVSGGTVYACTLAGRVFAIDEATGEQQWEASPGGVLVASPAVADGLLIIGGDTLAALDLSNGVTVWDRTLGGYVRSSPAASNGFVYAGDYAGRVYSFKLDGALAWSYDTGSAVRTSPAMAGGLVIIGNDNGLLYGLPLDAGQAPVVQELNARETYEGVSESFTALAYDPEGRDLTYSWSFGDGASDTGRVVHHTFGSAGNYTVSVTASDGQEETTVSGAVSVLPFASDVVDGDAGTPPTGPSNLGLYLAAGGAAAAATIGTVLFLFFRRRKATGVVDAPGPRTPPASPARAKEQSAPRPPAAPPQSPPAPAPLEFDYYQRQYGDANPPPSRPPRGPRRPGP